LFRIDCSSGHEPRFQPLPDGLKPNIHNVVRVTNHASLNSLPDYALLLWIEVNGHNTVPFLFFSAIEEILEGYPALDRESVELAPLYVQAFPRRGRPASRPWAKRKPARES
jgi:hypothetical protein